MAGDVIIQMLTHVRAEGQVIQPVTHTQKKNLGKIYERRLQTAQRLLGVGVCLFVLLLLDLF